MWSPMFSQSLFLVLAALACFSSSPPGYLYLVHPISSIVPYFDLALDSWVSFCLLQVHVISLHQPPYPWTSLDSGRELSSLLANP
jgi:hypothetical protein